MLKNFPDTNFFIKHNSAINLNNFLPYRNNSNNSKKNYKFNELNPIHSERNMNAQRTRNYKTPNRDNKSKMANSSVNLKSFNIPNSLRIPKKTESFFPQNNSNINSNSLLNSVRYISSPLLNQENFFLFFFTSYINISNNNKNNPKKTLILDLDETLVHSAFYPFQTKSDIVLNITLDGKNHIIHVLKRPNLDYFLKKVSELYNIIIFTASLSQYASPLIDILDPENKFKRLFRNHCLKRNGFYIKDLNQIGTNFKDIIIIDNNPISFIMNQDNGLPIMTWYENMNDNELIKLIPLLEYLSNVNDVRPIINQIVNRESNEIDFKIVKNLLLKYEGKIEDKIYKINGAYNNIEVKEKENNYYNQNNKENIDINNINIKNGSSKDKYSYNGNDKIYNFPYNNKQIYYSLSNMSYDEIQNEGYIENPNVNLEKDYMNNMNIFNGYRKNLIKNKKKINLFMKTKEIFNFSNNNENRLIPNENNKQISYDGNSFSKINNINQFPKDKSENYINYGINRNNNNYNFIYMSKKNNNILSDYNNPENTFQAPKDLSSNFYQNDDYEIPKDSITINYQEQNRLKNNSFDPMNNMNSPKMKENNLKDISSYRSNSVINRNKPKNFNLSSNNIYNQNQLYKKPINIKEKNNQNQNISEAKKIINYDLKEEENKDEKSSYKSKIEERKERLKEMKRKIEEINRDIKSTEQYYYQTQRKENKQNKENVYNNNVKTSRCTCNRININYQNENISNDDINLNSYKAQIIDTDINRNDNNENEDLNNIGNIFNKKNKYSNINIYRNSKAKYLCEHRSEINHMDDRYIKKKGKEKDFFFQTPNLKKGKLKNNIFKIYSNNAINRSNGKVNKSENKNKS